LETKNQKNDQHSRKDRIDAVLSYIPFLCFISLFKPDLDDFAKRHAKQGLLLLIIEIIALLFLVDLINDIFWTIILIACLIFAMVGVLKAMAGKEMKIPFIGNIFEKYDI